MSTCFDWFPDLILFETYANSWGDYLEAVYSFYKRDFLDTRPKYQNKSVAVKRLPIVDGKESNFWHLIQEGKEEDSRIPNLRRCERIRWPRSIIEHASETVIRVWENKRHTRSGIQQNVCLWFEDKEYLVILRKRREYYLLWTGYPVTREHQKNKLRKEYEVYKKAGDVISDDPVTPSTHGR